MTLLILSLWASGVLLLIAFAVYRGKSATAAPVASSAHHMSVSELTEIAKLSARLRAGSPGLETHKTSPAQKTGGYKYVRDHSPAHSGSGRLVASAGKPLKPGAKGAHVHFPKPGKSSR